jgi:hypothetical protein
MSAGYMATASWMKGSVDASNSAGDLSSQASRVAVSPSLVSA